MAGRRQQPAAGGTHWAAAVSAAASPSVRGWHERLGRPEGCSWGKAPHQRAAAAAGAPACCTRCSREACSAGRTNRTVSPLRPHSAEFN